MVHSRIFAYFKRQSIKWYKILLRNCHTNYIARLREVVPTDFKQDNDKNVLLLLTHGSEEMSAVVVSNIVMRAGITVRFTNLTGYEPLRLSHRIVVKPNYTIDEALKFEQGFDLIYVTSGYKAIDTLCHSKQVGDILKWQNYQRRYIAIADFSAIVLAYFGVGRGRKITAHPATEPIIGSFFHYVLRAPFLVDGNIVSIRSPASAARLAFMIIELISGDTVAETISRRLSFPYVTLKHKSAKEAAHKRLKGISLRENKEEWELRYKRTLSRGINRIIALSEVLEGKMKIETLDTEKETSADIDQKADLTDSFLNYVKTRMTLKSVDTIINETLGKDKTQVARGIAALEGLKQEYLDLLNELNKKYSHLKDNVEVQNVLVNLNDRIEKIDLKLKELMKIVERTDTEYTSDKTDKEIAERVVKSVLDSKQQTPAPTQPDTKSIRATIDKKLKLNPEDRIELPKGESITTEQVKENIHLLKQIKNNYLSLQLEIEEKFVQQKSDPKIHHFYHILSRKLHVVDEKIEEHEQLLKELNEKIKK